MKKIFKRVALAAVVVMLGLFVFDGNALATSEVSVKMEPGTTLHYLTTASGKNLLYSVKSDGQGNFYYCLEPSLKGPGWPEVGTYQSFPAGQPNLTALENRILALGYPNQSIPGFEGSRNQSYYVTQAAMYAASSRASTIYDIPNLRTASGTELQYKILTAVKDLYNRAQNSVNTSNNSIRLEGPDSAKLVGSNYVSGPYYVKTVNSTQFNLKLSVVGANSASIQDANGNIISSVTKSTTPIYVKYPVSTNSNTGKITLRASGVNTYKIGLFYASRVEGYQNQSSYSNYVENVELSASSNWVRTSSVVEITKTDATTGAPLSGARISIYKDGVNSAVYEGISNAKGQISVTLGLGTYTYREVTAPKGYYLVESVGAFEIKAGGEPIKLTIKNTKIPIGSVEILKVDSSNNNPLAGARIAIYDEYMTKKLSEGVTGSDGILKVESLEAGKYMFRELVAPNGYKAATVSGLFEIKTDKELVRITLKNDKLVAPKAPTGKVEISKTDLVTSEPIAGAKIEIFDRLGSKIYEDISDEKGKIYAELPYGKYTFKETVAPEGYILNTVEGEFEIVDSNSVVKAELKNEKMPASVDMPAEIPKTGPVETAISVIAVSAMSLSAVYWYKSQQALRRL